MVAPNTSPSVNAKSHITCHVIEDGNLAFDYERLAVAYIKMYAMR